MTIPLNESLHARSGPRPSNSRGKKSQGATARQTTTGPVGDDAGQFQSLGIRRQNKRRCSSYPPQKKMMNQSLSPDTVYCLLSTIFVKGQTDPPLGKTHKIS
jgi:hypothetical protein